MVSADGVAVQVLTPHIGRYPNHRIALEESFLAFETVARQAGVVTRLRLACEVLIGPEVQTLVDSDGIIWLGQCAGEQTFLLEFPGNSVPAGSMNLIAWLRNQRILPIIVHPERNRVFQSNLEKLKPYVEASCPIQITASSLIGRFGRLARKAAREMLKQGLVDIIASDCHNDTLRPPNLSVGVREASLIVGLERAVHMARQRPLELMGEGLERYDARPQIDADLCSQRWIPRSYANVPLAGKAKKERWWRRLPSMVWRDE